MRVLIVEDNEELAKMIGAMLLEKHEVDYIHDLKMLAWHLGRKAGSYDLMLLDYHMPGGTTLDVIMKIEEHKTFPIVMITASEWTVEMIEKSESVGVLMNIPKSQAVRREILLAEIDVAARMAKDRANANPVPKSPALPGE